MKLSEVEQKAVDSFIIEVEHIYQLQLQGITLVLREDIEAIQGIQACYDSNKLPHVIALAALRRMKESL